MENDKQPETYSGWRLWLLERARRIVFAISLLIMLLITMVFTMES